ncbi:MAG: hypothetical protein M1829_000391, partial [Trizodia sp. TS-e1964]
PEVNPNRSAAHSTHRVLDKTATEKVQTMSSAGIVPKQIISSLRAEDPDMALISGDIYNLRKKIRRKNLGF